ncbi:AAA family ATPase [Gordonia sp. HNM0687]|uniref:AAA family ATPase n=1 Tax=Gordonia mangrovi TaxID=2665643 RepID=A0A6L7GRK2_9ACTN|nr:AAA domain-containing protein [Gordonia mangrovi]MXP22589.1 AAA family ATPase [Gordonia mangrovi]UVF77541.1 AAA domain-containing protein [Gordonia mangrovi]
MADEGADTQVADRADQVRRLLGYLRELVRARFEVASDVEGHPELLWVGTSTSVAVRPGAVSGQTVLEIAPDDPAHADIERIVDQLRDNPEELELVVANVLVTVNDVAAGDVAGDDEDGPTQDDDQSAGSGRRVRDHLVTQQVVAERDDTTGVVRVALGAGAAPAVHDAALLATIDGVDLSGALKARAKLTELPNPVGSRVGAAVDLWRRQISVDTDKVTLSVELRPALVLRRRGVAAVLDFYDAVLAELRESSDDLPVGLAQLVEPIEAAERVAALDVAGALAPDELVRDALYPLPANVEQRDVLAQLGLDSGVVVEGPPGTGKTHTIANLTAALLAKGQRVLVTSEKAHALQVLRDMLPPELRDLTVSIADVGTDDFAATVSSVESIADRKSRHQPRVVAAEITDLMGKRDQAVRRRERVLRDLWAARESETEVHEWVAGDYRGTPAEVVRQCRSDASRYEWLPGPVEGVTPPLDVDEFELLRALLTTTAVGSGSRFGQRLPDLSGYLPEPAALDDICARIAQRPSEPMVGSGSLLSILAGVGSARLVRIKKVCERLAVAASEVAAFPPTMVDMADRLLDGQAAHLWSRVVGLSAVIADAADRDRAIGGHVVVVENARPGDDAVFAAAAEYLDDGGHWRGRLRRSPQQRAVEESGVRATVDGREPVDARSLQLVADHLAVLDAVGRVQRVLADLHVPVDNSGTRSAQLNTLVRLDNQLAWISELMAGRDQLVRELEAISPGGPRPRSVAAVTEVAVQAGAIAATNDAVIAEHELADCAYRLSVEVEQGPSPEGDALLSAMAGADAEKIRVARRAWNTAREELDAQTTLDLLTLRLRSKAPEFFARFAESAEDPVWHTRLRDLGGAWSWRRAQTWVAERSDPTLETRLQAELDEIEADIAGLTVRVTAARAWQACLERMTVAEVQALQSYRDHMINLGKGSGKHANRFRVAARAAMEQAQGAVPAWIMSLAQVAETVDPRRDAFDVVIVDEASQADITSSFLLWLAPRVIVVGDDRQCAPTGLSGTTLDDAFAKLDAHLPDLPHYLRDGLTPRSSLFALLRSRFGHLIRLREHFRSMPEIIEFSSRQFYAGAPLNPVRQFGADRLPPLRSVHVENGVATGQGASLVNEREAEAIAETLAQCLLDPAYDTADFGVIVLQGTKQVDEITRRLREVVSDEQWRSRRIRVGTPPDFQGDERRVIFLSMVVSDPAAIAALTRAESQRRINVAASRAMDQMWLFRSIEVDQLKPNDLRRSLSAYVESTQGPTLPAMPEEVSDTERRQPFSSLFEQRVFNRLVQRGYHVLPGVTVNNRVIDLVVTGADARMAVECDGDTFRTTGEQARSDMERERELRRCGWEFWRVRESEFELDPDVALAGLWEALDRRGVKPGSVAARDGGTPTSTPQPVWTPIDLSSGD